MEGTGQGASLVPPALVVSPTPPRPGPHHPLRPLLQPVSTPLLCPLILRGRHSGVSVVGASGSSDNLLCDQRDIETWLDWKVMQALTPRRRWHVLHSLYGGPALHLNDIPGAATECAACVEPAFSDLTGLKHLVEWWDLPALIEGWDSGGMGHALSAVKSHKIMVIRRMALIRICARMNAEGPTPCST